MGKLFALIAILASLSGEAQKPVVTQFMFPGVDYAINNFTVLANGFTLLPMGGGVYMPGHKMWYYPPVEKQFILSVSPSVQDTSLYLVSDLMNQTQLFRWFRNIQGQEEIEQLAILPKGIYSVFPIGEKKVFLWGYSEGKFGIWRQNGNLRDTLFTSVRPISAVAPFHEHAIFFAYEKSVYLMASDRPVKKISSFKHVIDGLAVANDGSLFVSTKEGVVRIFSRERAELIVSTVHGYLQWKNNALYILDQPNNRILRIQSL